MTTRDAEQLNDLLSEIRIRLSRVHHDINNPLSIISGNIQLLRELSEALEVNDDLSEPLQDVEEAIEKLIDSVDELMVVRNLLADVSKEE